jgi:hypothetical protein
MGLGSDYRHRRVAITSPPFGCQVGRIDFRSDERNDIEGRLRQERGIEGEGEGWWMVWLTQGRAVLRSPYLGERERGDEREGRVKAI